MDHWTEKEVWIAEAIQKGGTGRIYCDDCSTYEKNGYGSMCCRTCREAERCFPGKSVEYWNGGDGDTQPCEAFEYRKEEKTFDDWFTGGRGYQSDDPLWIPE